MTIKKIILPILLAAMIFSSVSGYAAVISEPELTTGGMHTAALNDEGVVYTWGGNKYGGLGNSHDISNWSTAPVALADVMQISCGTYHTAAVTSDGSVWSWGYNKYGQLGNNSAENAYAPVQAAWVYNIRDVACGARHTAALKSDGTVWTWGDNTTGQIGDGTNIRRGTPVQVIGLNNVIQVDCGWGFTAALKSDGSVWTWGINTYGQLGTGNQYNSNAPVKANINDVKAIACGDNHMLAIKNDGTVWAWGSNSYGQLGDGTFQFSPTPKIIDTMDEAIAIAAGDHSLVLRNDGTVWGCGFNQYGQLGGGFTQNGTAMMKVNIDDVIKISASTYNSMFLKEDGNVYMTGKSSDGQIGNGTNQTQTTPVLNGLNLGLTSINQPSEWAVNEMNQAKNAGFIPPDMFNKFKYNITRGDFCRLAIEFIQVKTATSVDDLIAQNPSVLTFSDTDDKVILLANSLGIVSGFEDGTFRLDKSITREQASAMLVRMLNYLGMNEPNSERVHFDDTSFFSPWAVEYISFISACVSNENGVKVMGGVGNNTFNSQGRYTKEQAFASFYRLFNCV